MAAAERREFGTVRQRGSGRWQATYRVDGSFHTAPQTFMTRKAAAAWLAGTKADLDRGSWVDPHHGKVTLGEYGDDWLAGRQLRPTTRAKYRHLLDLNVLPKLGSRELAKLAAIDVRRWYEALANRSQTQADDSYRMLRAIVRTAVADGLIVKSPCQVKGGGSVKSPERPTASPTEVAKAIEAVPERLRLAFLLMAWCQLRRGEVLGLQRGDVDLEAGTIRVERARVVPLGGPAEVGPPKTEAGSRTLNVPCNALPALEDHMERFVGPKPDAWLFGTSTGSAVSPRNLQRAWDRAREAAARPDLHMHDLRHSGLTWAAATGATTAELMQRGGHANPRAALRYQHVAEGRDKAVAEALAKLA